MCLGYFDAGGGESASTVIASGVQGGEIAPFRRLCSPRNGWIALGAQAQGRSERLGQIPTCACGLIGADLENSLGRIV